MNTKAPVGALENPAVAAGISNSNRTGAVSACVEVDLRIQRDDQRHYVRHALDGLRPGDVVKLMVNRASDPTALYQADLSGVHVQLTAESVHTMRMWTAVTQEAVV